MINAKECVIIDLWHIVKNNYVMQMYRKLLLLEMIMQIWQIWVC